MTILVIAEHDNASLKSATGNAISAAQKIGGDIAILIAGHQCRGAADAAAKIDGISKVLLADAAHYGHGLGENLASLIVGMASGYTHLVAPATTSGKNVMPRVAALLDVAQISDVIAVESVDTFVRPIYAGNALATVQSKDAVKVLTVRTSAFPNAASGGGTAAIETIAAAADVGLSEFVGQELTKSERPELGAARIVISGRSACRTARISRCWKS
jgi:electron transfer flavoprotein alpha subunit